VGLPIARAGREYIVIECVDQLAAALAPESASEPPALPGRHVDRPTTSGTYNRRTRA